MNIMVVLNYNDHETTINYIQSVEDYESIDRIIVVDNKSSDGSYERLKFLESDKVDVIQTPVNDGYSSGNNFGSKYAINKYRPDNIIISNPDIIVKDISINKFTELLDREDNLAAVTGLIHDLNEKVVDNFAWKLPNYWDMLFSNFMSLNYIRRELFNKGIEYDIKSNQIILQADVLHGCFFVVKSSVLEEVKYFDERTFLYGEENIFFHKVKALGLQQAVLMHEKIIHMEGVSINKAIKGWKKKYAFYEQSRILYLRECLGVSDLKIKVFKVFFNLGKYEKVAINRIRKRK